MTFVDRFLECPSVYRLWQAPFARQKFAPVVRSNDLRRIRRVLDVGCGPGTNREYLSHTDYIGIDINQRYIRRARARTGGSYIVADVDNLPVAESAAFDFILVNSLLHHIPTPRVRVLLRRLAGLLSETGTIHVLDLVVPAHGTVARFLAEWDRGDYPRPWAEWEELLSGPFRPVILEDYSIGVAGLPLWHMLYFQGRIRE
jgi:SAM-dependent methyltransferase